ncbi:MAG: polyphosphate kinase 2 [Phototrophicaceae bacterium]
MSDKKIKRLPKKLYDTELERLQFELVKLQYWIREKGLRLLITFDGRDAAGKGGIIKRLIAPLQPRGVRLVALGKPSDVERTQWFFQRYVQHLPSAGEIVIFDRSWYNRATVERVMGFSTDQEYWDFMRSAPQFERMLVNSGIVYRKYWLSVSQSEQERRFQDRAHDPSRRWKLSPIDLASRTQWVEYSRAKDIMIEHTDIPESRWRQVDANDKRRMRLNVIRDILQAIAYENIIPKTIELDPRPKDKSGYERPPRDNYFFVKDHYKDDVK